jgi:hypothetical protein
MGFPLLPQLSAATELCIINLIAQHDPQPNSQFASRCDPRFSHSLLHQLATIEALQLPIFLYRMHRCFRPQIAQQLVAFLGQFSQALSFSAGALAGNHPDIAGHLVAGGKRLASPRNTSVARAVTGPTPGCVISRRDCGLCRAWPSTSLSSSWIRFWSCPYKPSSSFRR